MTTYTTEHRNAAVLKVLREAEGPLAPRQIAAKISEPWCCYGAYCDIGHSDDCPSRANPPAPAPRAVLGTSQLRPATRPPKPRLRPCMGIWTCETANIIAKGRTPAEDYREWSKATIIRGAEIHRSLRPFA